MSNPYFRYYFLFKNQSKALSGYTFGSFVCANDKELLFANFFHFNNTLQCKIPNANL